jgi:1A family penicillin-binding protein
MLLFYCQFAVFATIESMSMWQETVRRRRRFRYSSFSSPTSTSHKLALFAKLGFLAVVFLLLASFIVIPLFAFNLPSPDKVVRREGFSTKILDRNGKVLYDIFSDQRRTPVELDQMPVYLREATIAIEDKNFYKHQGFDPLGILRGFSRIVTRGRAQGGSTLTQQLVKNVLLTPERTVFRKIREFILAVQIERKYSKDEILRMYLNEAPYGGTAWGVEAAAETYFGKKVSDLNLVESAFLAGLPQRPSFYSPYSGDKEAYKGRTEQVLRRMREDGYLTKEQEAEAVAQIGNLEIQEKGANFKAPHFVQYVQGVLEERYGPEVVEQGGLRVTTTLDLELQEEAQKIVAEEIAKVESLHITNGAAVVLDPKTSEILSMVGSKDFNAADYDGQVNVTVRPRQPGSAIKPVTYVTALKEGYTPSSLIMDVPTTFPGGNQKDYKPVNYDGKYRGPLQLRFALANSINVAAVKVLALVGIEDTLQTAYDLGINSLKPTKETLSRVGLSLTLGGGEVKLLELTGAFGAFVNEGHKVEPVSILKVEDSKGKVLEETKLERGKQVISSEQAFLIAHILSDNQARSLVFGTNSLLNVPGWQIAVKTGTTNDKRDNWTLGGNEHVVVGVWVGNNDNSAMREVASGVSGASPIWRKILLESLKGKAKISFKAPSGIVTASVDAVSGYRAHDNFPSRSELFIKGTEPGDDPVHLLMKICKTDGGIANPADIAGGNYDSHEYFVFKEEDPMGPPNRWQQGIDEWLATQTEPKYHPPTRDCGTNPLGVRFTSPEDKQQVSANFDIKISTGSISQIEKVELFINGESKRTFTGPPYEFNTQDLNLEDGIYELLARAKDKDGREAEVKITIGVNVTP